MEDMNDADIEEKTLANVFEEEKEKWKSKMVNLFGDLCPYKSLKTKEYEIEKIPETEESAEEITNATEIFERLSSTYQIEKEAEREFNKELENIDITTVSPHLSEILEQRKRECLDVFEQFDKVAEMSEKYFHLEYKDCRERGQQQMSALESMMRDVGNYLSEVEEAGDRELKCLKDSISSYIKELGESWSHKIDVIYKNADKNKLLVEVWNDFTDNVTSKDVHAAFLKDQRETALVWGKAYKDLMMLATELERYRYNYTRTKANMERSIYWMQRNYRDNLPELMKTQKQQSSLVTRRTQLSDEIRSLMHEIVKEKKKGQEMDGLFKKKMIALREIKEQNSNRAFIKHKNVYEAKQCEVSDLLQEVLEGDKFIFEEILYFPWIPPKSLEWESENIAKENAETLELIESPTEDDSITSIKTLNDDKFADSFRLLITSGDFEDTLNRVSLELGFMLDFEWVDYAKKTLEIEKEIKWIELFKVFKLDFDDDLKDLKEHMMKFSKSNTTGELVFDQSDIVEGFIQFVTDKKKRESLSTSEEIQQGLPKDAVNWNSIQTSIPKIYLWDSVIALLEKYRDLLTSRQKLMTSKAAVEGENEELDKLLRNFYSYDMPD